MSFYRASSLDVVAGRLKRGRVEECNGAVEKAAEDRYNTLQQMFAANMMDKDAFAQQSRRVTDVLAAFRSDMEDLQTMLMQRHIVALQTINELEPVFDSAPVVPAAAAAAAAAVVVAVKQEKAQDEH